MTKLIANKQANISLIEDNAPIRIIISSLSLGGAEKIVVDWAESEGKRGRPVELVVLHNKTKEHKVKSSNVSIYRRKNGMRLSEFLSIISEKWSDGVPVSTHLLDLTVHQFLWKKGMKTVPVIHNDRKGWKLSATELNHKNVVGVVACAKYVKDQLVEDGCDRQINVIRHSPLVPEMVFSEESRITMRKKFNISNDTLLIGLIGAIKHQKNYNRLIEIAEKTTRNVEFLIFGDAVNKEGIELKKELLSEVDKRNINGKIIFMGFQENVFKYYPILDGVLNCSDFEGYSIATQEALLSGIPVIATKVSGQSEIALDGLTLIESSANDMEFVNAIEALPVRETLQGDKLINATRIWSLSLSKREPKSKLKTLFLTANLNAGGAQRSLVNIATHIKDDVAVAVCNDSTNDYFSNKLSNSGIEHFQLSKSRDVFDLTKSLLNVISERDIENLVLWNVDPKMKLLLSEFLPDGVKYYDVSPGGYAFEELDATQAFQKATTIRTEDFYARVEKLVLKFDADTSAIDKYDVETMVIRNGVEDWSRGKEKTSTSKEILVSGRIVGSKHVLSIIRAFKEFNKDQDYTLSFYGQAEERNKDYLGQVNKESQGESINFMGADPYLSFMKKDFAMTIVLGTHQGCPNAVLESASGLIPVLANDSGGTREIIKDGESGVLIPDQFTHDELVSAMFRMTTLERVSLLERAKENVSTMFSMPLMMDNYKTLFGH